MLQDFDSVKKENLNFLIQAVTAFTQQEKEIRNPINKGNAYLAG